MNRRILFAFALLGQILASAPTTRGQVYEKVFSLADRRIADLRDSPSKGRSPDTSLVEGRDGNYYGTTASGGTSDNNGTIFRMTPAGVVTTLVEFTFDGSINRGATPDAALVQGNDGNFYGTTRAGGAHGEGTLFKMTPIGVLTTLVDFGGLISGGPRARLLVLGDGSLIGTTTGGEFGSVFRVSPSGVLSVLTDFDGPAGGDLGSDPLAGLILGSDGFFYGTTSRGGENDLGTVFKMTPEGVLTTLVHFTGNGATEKGSSPEGELVEGASGIFYGTTATGGAGNRGTVFKVTSGGVLTTLAEFGAVGAGNVGDRPVGSLVRGSDGAFYGVTQFSTIGAGSVFKVTVDGQLTTLFEFNDEVGEYRGAQPYEGLILSSDGLLYGTTHRGGPLDHGTIFKTSSSGDMRTVVEFSFQGRSETGTAPLAGLIQAADGALYGTTYAGGLNEGGTVFKVTPAGQLTTLASFTRDDEDGAFLETRLLQASDGSFYGATSESTPDYLGTIFRMSSDGALTTLFSFTGATGSHKGDRCAGGLIEGSDGNFYGTTVGGGSGGGTIFRLTPQGVFSTLIEFTGNGATNKGSGPLAGLVEDGEGNFYGTTVQGGTAGFGTIFKLTQAGVLSTLVNFTDNGAFRGAGPIAALTFGTDGNLYGTTSNGGLSFGTVFKMTPAGVLTTLVEFSSSTPENGTYPVGGLVQAGDGNFYGTTGYGGANNLGTIFQMTASGILTTVFDFAPDPLEARPTGTLALGADGHLYGTASNGAGNPLEDSYIFRVLLPGAPSIYVVPPTAQSPASVLLKAQVNARGATTVISLEYGTDGTTFPTVLPIGSPLSGFQTTLLGTTLAGLSPATNYFYRFSALSSAGTTLTPVQSFSTLAEPIVTVGAASGITATGAQFNGMVNARNFDTTAVFEWGTDGNAFPNTVAATPGTVTGSIAAPVSAAVAGLPQGGTVFYRLRAMNAAGTAISGVRSFSTVSVTTSNPLPTEIGVTEATFRATIDTFGQTALVKFKYWADSAPTAILETATQTVTSNGPVEVSARVTRLLESASYSYRVSVELAGTETDGSAVAFTTDTNEAPVALPDLVFYAGQVEIKPLENDSDPNSGSNAELRLAPTLVSGPNASLGAAAVSADRVSISYNPAFNVRADDALTYRVIDAQGATADGQVRLIAFSKRAGLYGGKINFGSGANAREGQIAVQMGTSGLISTSFMAWPNAGEGVRESFVLKGQFDQQGRLVRTLNSSSGAVLTLTLQLDADLPQIRGTFEERVSGTSTTGEVIFTLTKNAGTGGLAESGLRTGFLSPPPEQAGVMADGYVRMTVGKDNKRGARFAGRLPDGEPFLVSAKAQGRTYEIARKLEQGGVFTGLVRAIDGSTAAGGMMGDLYWQKRPSGRARFHRGGVESMLALSGVAYPVIPRGGLPPIGLGSSSPNARLRLSGGDFNRTYRDLLLNILPGGVQIIGPDNLQSGVDLQTLSTNKMTIKFDARQAKFTGKFLHPETDKPVTFEGALRSAFDNEPGQGRGVFRGPTAAGAVRIEGR